MSVEVAAVVLLAAALHAGWNTLIKISGDRISVMAFVTLAGSLISLPLLPFVDSPAPASWPFLAATILLHTGYHFFLPVAYNHGDLGQIYPLARGAAPILVTLGALIFAGEVLEPLGLAGVLCLAVGVMTLTFDRSSGIKTNPKAVCFALATGACIASYTVVDGLGARLADSVLGFAVWLTIGDGFLTFLIALAWKGRAIWCVARSNLVTGFAGGAMQVGAYWIIVWALAVAPMGSVSALRETSVLFAALISTLVLKEGWGAWRFISVALVSFGLMLQRVQK
jgi:drug/metabolite transporter (DMT)-like permease